MEERLEDFAAAHADTLAQVGLPADAPHVPERLPADVRREWRRLWEGERELLQRCMRCACLGLGLKT